MIELEILGVPEPWTAPRRSRGGYYDIRHNTKEQARWQLRSQYTDKLLEGEITIDLTFYVPIPKRTSKVRRRLMMMGLIKPTSKPDTTNYQKLYEDTLTGIVIKDDAAVTDIASRKRYSAVPRVVIKVSAETPEESCI